MRTLTLNVKTKYFEQIKSGTKTKEFRLQTAYWQKRLETKSYDMVTICKGYPKRDDMKRRLSFHWNGYEKMSITHEFFGASPVEVYAIDLSKPIEQTGDWYE